MFISDNSEVNNVTIDTVLAKLRLDIVDSWQWRSYCLGHIINLIAKAFLFGSNVNAFKQAADDNFPLELAVAHAVQAT